jgi:hypothetical protein
MHILIIITSINELLSLSALLGNFIAGMRILLLLAILCSPAFSPKAVAQLFQESMEERANRRSSYEGFLIEEVRKFTEVKKKEEQILRLSNKQRHAIFWVSTDGLGLYTVKMIEDNGSTLTTHFVFNVDSASGRVLNKDGKP